MCPNLLEEVIKERIRNGIKPKAIIVVHLYEMLAKMIEIVEVAKRYLIILIEEAAEALGSSYKGSKWGTFGDFGILSFNINKIISTSGGGALICKNSKDQERAIYLVTQVRDKEVYYEHSQVGYNYRMSNVLAGRCQIQSLDAYVAIRSVNNLFYQEVFHNVNGVTVFQEPNKNYFSNHWLSCILIDDAKTKFTSEDLRLSLKK